MTEVERPQTSSPSPLRALLLARDGEPVAQIDRLRAARAAATAPAIARELDAVELRYLSAQAHAPGADPALRAAVADAERAWLALEQRSLSAAPRDAADALFDLADLRAALRARGRDADSRAVAAEIDRRVGQVPVDPALREEARERCVALTADEEDLPLHEKIPLLQETAAVLRQLAVRSGDAELRRLARRLWRASCDRILAQRLEQLLTRRGVVVLETLSFALLLVLLVLLPVEAVLSAGGATSQVFVWIDAGICGFFVLEFALKLALSPSRTSWFLRNAVTDLLPALPAALMLLDVPQVPAANEAIVVRALRLLRIAYFARYVQALRPVLRLFRLLLFMVRGLDQLVRRFSGLLNRNFVFFETAAREPERDRAADPRRELFQVLRREHALLDALPGAARAACLSARGREFATRLEATSASPRREPPPAGGARDVPVERAIEYLHALGPDDLALSMSRSDLRALDRVVRVLNAPLIRALPFIRGLRSPRLGATPQERVVDFGQRIANRLEWWHERILFVADLHGILTGPQVLDRIATTMVRTSQRPAIRLLLYGGLFLVVRFAVGENSGAGEFLKRFVATPLLVLGGVSLVLLWIGRWLKRLAGEAAETMQRTSEAHFIALLELQKSRHEDVDTAFLARRVLGQELDGEQAPWALSAWVGAIRTGSKPSSEATPSAIRDDLERVALLYLHFLDGAILHDRDVKTNQQLLANLSLENIRAEHLRFSRRDRKRLRRLALDEGSLLSGPYLWFRFITESVALETARRVIDYNRNCVPAVLRARAPAAAARAMDAWIAKRRAEMSGRSLDRIEVPEAGSSFVTTEFNALDFLSPDGYREERIERLFGADVLQLLRADRRHMIREIFGTRPLDRLPRSRRILNFYVLYLRRLSGGRILLMPLYWLVIALRTTGFAVAKTVELIREIVAPERAKRRRVSGSAPFAVALRKIHRMKAPGLLEAIAMRAAFDPAYGGAPVSWSDPCPLEEPAELERDMDFLRMRERDREKLRARATAVRALVEECHVRMRGLPPLGADGGSLERRLGERAVTIAWVNDRAGIRTLLRAEAWLERTAIALAAGQRRAPQRYGAAAAQCLQRGGRPHPVDRWLRERLHGRALSPRAHAGLRWAYSAGERDVRATVDAWLALPAGVAPQQRGLELAREAFANHQETSRDLTALRAVQSLSVLDVRNYRQLVFRLGGYADEGEDPRMAAALP